MQIIWNQPVCRIWVIKNYGILDVQTAFVVDLGDKLPVITSAILSKDVQQATVLKLMFEDMTITIRRHEYDVVEGQFSEFLMIFLKKYRAYLLFKGICNWFNGNRTEKTQSSECYTLWWS